MKKVLSIVILLCLLLSFSVTSFAEIALEWASEKPMATLSVVSDGNGKWAVVNSNGNIVLDYSEYPKEIAKNGLIAVLGDNSLIGFYDRYGTRLTDFIYDAFIKHPEKSVIPGVTIGYLSNLFNFEGDGKSDLLAVSYEGKFGYINSMGQVVIPYKYEYAYGFHSGIARICADGVLSEYGTYTQGKYGYLRENGEEILPPDSYWTATDIDDEWGYATASNGENDTILIDKFGNYKKCDATGYAKIDAPFIRIKSNGRYGIVDRDNNVIIPPVAENEIYYKIGDVFIVDNTLRNSKNEILYTAPEKGFLDVQYKKNYFLLRMPNYRLGLVDISGRVIIEPMYEDLSDLGGGLIFAGNSNKGHLYNSQGKELCELNVQIQTVYDDGFFKAYDYDAGELRYYVNPLMHPKVYVDGEKVEFSDAYPIISNDRTLVPLRAVFEKMGAVVGWDNDERIAYVIKDDITVSVPVGTNKLNINGKVKTIDVESVIKNDRTYIPLRAISESIGATVEWNEEDRAVIITTK